MKKDETKYRHTKRFKTISSSGKNPTLVPLDVSERLTTQLAMLREDDSNTRWAKCLQKFEECLRCPICFDFMQWPAIGTCGHSLCSHHVALLGEGTCPVCRCVGAFAASVPCQRLQTILLVVQQQQRRRVSSKAKGALRNYMDSASRKKLRHLLSRLAQHEFGREIICS